MSPRIIEAARGNGKNVNRKSDKTVTDLDLTTKDSVTRNPFKKNIKRFAFIVASLTISSFCL